jgi:hypothetical protein
VNLFFISAKASLAFVFSRAIVLMFVLEAKKEVMGEEASPQQHKTLRRTRN